MSFRLRFILIACLVLVMVALAALALHHLRADRDSALEAAAISAGDGLVDALERHASERRLDVASLAARLAADSRQVEQVVCRGLQCDSIAAGESDAVDVAGNGADASEVEALLASVARSSGGYCAPDGRLLLARTSQLGFPPARLLPADSHLARVACAQASTSPQTQHLRKVMPRDLLRAAARATGSGLIAWSLTRLPPPSQDANRGRLLAFVTSMTLVCLLLVLLTLDGWRLLRRGTADLQAALVRLRGDLRAEIPMPAAPELARVAAGLHAMAVELADARAREQGLERKLGHEQRLAGLGRVVAGVAHEVRNPITGIKLKLDGLMRRGADERTRADVAICLEEIARLDRVVSSLLMVARAAPMSREPLALEQLVDERVAHAEGLATERDIAVRRVGRVHTLANREVLTAVLDNLLRNALEASPPRAEVQIELGGEPGATYLEVCDRGEGIPQGRVAELFEPFFTLKPSGTGLGLFLSRSLLEPQGGSLSYRRDQGRTIFRVELP